VDLRAAATVSGDKVSNTYLLKTDFGIGMCIALRGGQLPSSLPSACAPPNNTITPCNINAYITGLHTTCIQVCIYNAGFTGVPHPTIGCCTCTGEIFAPSPCTGQSIIVVFIRRRVGLPNLWVIQSLGIRLGHPLGRAGPCQRVPH
jgi:hypothetical protein